MSTDAMAVVVGVAVGVAASVPTSLLLVALLRRERQSWRTERPAPSYPAFQPPNIIVVDPSKYALPSQPAASAPMPLPEPAQDGGLHRLRVIGADEEWSTAGSSAEWTR